MDGFIIVVGKDGKIIYVSDTVNNTLGLSSYQLMGKNLFDFVHKDDSDELKDILSVDLNAPIKCNVGYNIHFDRTFILRIKCFLPKKHSGLTTEEFKVK